MAKIIKEVRVIQAHTEEIFSISINKSSEVGYTILNTEYIRSTQNSNRIILFVATMVKYE